MRENSSKLTVGERKIICGREEFSLVMAAKGKKRRTFRFIPESCDNEADQNSLFCQRIQKAVQGEITNK